MKIAISGKGGVGKTNVSINLAVALADMGKRVMILDADLGLANIDIALGLHPEYDLSHVLRGERSLSEVVLEGPAGIRVVPASSGVQKMAELSTAEHAGLINAFSEISNDIDVLVVDTAAGISDTVISFSRAAQELVVVVCDEPASITDAYALMKVLSLQYGITRFNLLVNQAGSDKEAREIFNHLQLVTHQFLDISIHLKGHIFKDENIARGVRCQRMVSDIYPNSNASDCFKAIAKQIYDTLPKSTQ